MVSAAALLLAGCVRFEDKPIAPAASAEALESRSLSDPAFRKFLETNLHRELTSWPLQQVDLPIATLAAFYFHPSLDVARAQWASVRAGESTAGARPNPVLGVTPGYSANPPKGVSPWFPSVTLDVPIETAGKRGYRIAQAEHLSAAARANITSAAWQVRSGVRAALLDYETARRRAALLSDQVTMRQRATELLEQRLAAGAISAPELAPARLALVHARLDAADAARVAAEARVKVAEAIGLPAAAIHRVEFRFDLSADQDAPVSSAEARREALVGRADVLALLSEYAASQSALQLEIAKQYPDVHFNPGYQYDQGENKWQLGISMELPVLYRNQGGIREAVARRDEVAARFIQLQAKVIAEIDRAAAARASAIEQLKQLDELARAQREVVEQVEASFKAGAADQFELATARLEFAVTELAHVDALSKQQQAIGLWEDALQRPFAALEGVERDPKLHAHK